MAAQASDEQRRAAADVWLDNSGTTGDLRALVDALWRERLVPFEHNVRHGIRSRRPEALRLCAGDPTWPAQARRLAERVGRAFGATAVSVDHVGSTAVPGLPAKDVIDLQVAVTSLADVDEPWLVERLQAAGFPRVPGIDADNSKNGQPWPKRFHGSSDPARVAHIHVREAGSPGWRWALMFRDWLCAEPAAAREYAAEKDRIAATGASTSEYTEAKEPWFSSVADRAEAWARESGWESPRD
jgi:dephospho-CoA kinase